MTRHEPAPSRRQGNEIHVENKSAIMHRHWRRYLAAALFLLMVLSGAACSPASPTAPTADGGLVDTGNWFDGNTEIIRTDLRQFSDATGITASVVATSSGGADTCAYGWESAQGWGRATGPAMVFVFTLRPRHAKVCVNDAAARKVSAMLPATLDVFDTNAEESRWASAVVNTLTGLKGEKGRALLLPDAAAEEAAPVNQQQARSDDTVAIVLVAAIGVTSAVLVGAAMLAHRSAARRVSLGHVAVSGGMRVPSG